MKLRDLITGLDHPEVRGSTDLEVTGIAYDSQKVVPGMLFVAIRGQRQDGHHFVEQAVARGANAVVVEDRWDGKDGRAGAKEAHKTRPAPCVVLVKDTRKALSALAHHFFGKPSYKLGVIGVTGTNGKTTTACLIKNILEAAGKKAGLLGTVGYYVGREVLPAQHTTPESFDLQGLLSRMADAGSDYVVMEVSSHALALDRVGHCAFDVAVFTNLSQDHLDFHVNMEDYFRAKLKLFSGLGVDNPKAFPRMAVVNQDDPRAAEVIASTRVPCWTYGSTEKATLAAENIRLNFDGIRFLVNSPKGKFEVQSPLTGRYNIANILAAIGVGLCQNIPIAAIQKGVREIGQVPGRFEKIQEGQEFWVVVDYAHTDDALRQLLLTARELALASPLPKGRILVVFGCGGDRDRSKRKKMGQVAAALSDVVILTSDNPRTEDPCAIIREIEAGIRLKPGDSGRSPNYLIIHDRAAAIEKAISMASPGDMVVIAGKGHENYQIIGTKKLPFDDREIAREAIRRLKGQLSQRPPAG